jgi:hypothetical protein
MIYPYSHDPNEPLIIDKKRLRKRVERNVPTEQAAQYFTHDNPILSEPQRLVYSEVAKNLRKRDLNEDSGMLDLVKKWRAADPRRIIPPEPKRLPPKIGMNELLGLIQNMHRDIKFIKDAQSYEGAMDWIYKNGYQDSLNVVNEDIDGDNIPDIIIKNRVTGEPYVVKGYTTTQSDYPYHYRYYTNHPTKESRKEEPYKDWLNNILVSDIEFDNDSKKYTRKYNPETLKQIELSRSKGYKLPIPPQKLSLTTSFNHFILKPIMTAIKMIIKDSYNSSDDYKIFDISIDGKLSRQIESYIRANVIYYPVLGAIYGVEELKGITQDKINKLIMRKDVREACQQVIIELIKNKGVVAREIMATILEILFNKNKIPHYEDENKDEVLNYYLDRSWNQLRINTEISTTTGRTW